MSELHIANLGCKTDIAVMGPDCTVHAADDHIVVSTPQRPDFYWGSYLLLPRAPAVDRVDAWIERFRETFPAPEIRHVSIAWQDSRGDAPTREAFARRGFREHQCWVSSTREVPQCSHPCEGLQVIELESDEDWRAAEEMSRRERDPIHSEEGYARFIAAQYRARRAQAAAGQLHWYLARLDGVGVGSMGLHVDDGVGRFQDVITHEHYRRRGVCSSLLTEVCRRGLEELGAETLVILAEVGEPAWRVYQRHGFTASERMHSVWLPPPSD